jgi:hypothetical protein
MFSDLGIVNSFFGEKPDDYFTYKKKNVNNKDLRSFCKKNNTVFLLDMGVSKTYI